MKKDHDKHNLLELQDFLVENKEFWEKEEKEIDNLLESLENPEWSGFN